MRTIHRTIVSALIISQDNKLLMGMKDPTKGGVYSDCWHIPGGGVDEGENELTTLRRELLEEVGIDSAGQKIEKVYYQGTGENEKVLASGERVLCKMSFKVFKIQLDAPADKVKLSLNDDLVKVEWVKLDELSNYKLTPPSIELFTRLGWLK